MEKGKKILIVKHGALGDVVRTSIFARAIVLQQGKKNQAPFIYWLTADSAVQLLRFNPYITRIVTHAEELSQIEFDQVYSLDDEIETLKQLKIINAKQTIGAWLGDGDKIQYCKHSSIWFDMGLVSQLGKKKADELKKLNTKTHGEIFTKIFAVTKPEWNFYGNPELDRQKKQEVDLISKARFPIGINPKAGSRWPSKSIQTSELRKLLSAIKNLKICNSSPHVFIFGSDNDRQQIKQDCGPFDKQSNITFVDTESDVLALSSYIKAMKLLITSDSLALHFAVSNFVPTVAFFSSTSSAEIENRNSIIKVVSTKPDYCSYRPSADNSTITASRLLNAVNDLSHLKIF